MTAAAPPDIASQAAMDAARFAALVREDEAQRARERPERMKAAALDDLERLQHIAMDMAEIVGRRSRGLLRQDEREGGMAEGDNVLDLVRISRAVRQIIVLQEEILGLRERPVRRAPGARNPGAPTATAADPVEAAMAQSRNVAETSDIRDRSDLNDYDDLDDYDHRDGETVFKAVREVVEDQTLALYAFPEGRQGFVTLTAPPPPEAVAAAAERRRAAARAEPPHPWRAPSLDRPQSQGPP
jgi:hypothetical protein